MGTRVWITVVWSELISALSNPKFFSWKYCFFEITFFDLITPYHSDNNISSRIHAINWFDNFSLSCFGVAWPLKCNSYFMLYSNIHYLNYNFGKQKDACPMVLFCETWSKKSVEVYRGRNLPSPPSEVTDRSDRDRAGTDWNHMSNRQIND
jgi:hypothetical protein